MYGVPIMTAVQDATEEMDLNIHGQATRFLEGNVPLLEQLLELHALEDVGEEEEEEESLQLFPSLKRGWFTHQPLSCSEPIELIKQAKRMYKMEAAVITKVLVSAAFDGSVGYIDDLGRKKVFLDCTESSFLLTLVRHSNADGSKPVPMATARFPGLLCSYRSDPDLMALGKDTVAYFTLQKDFHLVLLEWSFKKGRQGDGEVKEQATPSQEPEGGGGGGGGGGGMVSELETEESWRWEISFCQQCMPNMTEHFSMASLKLAAASSSSSSSALHYFVVYSGSHCTTVSLLTREQSGNIMWSFPSCIKYWKHKGELFLMREPKVALLLWRLRLDGGKDLVSTFPEKATVAFDRRPWSNQLVVIGKDNREFSFYSYDKKGGLELLSSGSLPSEEDVNLSNCQLLSGCLWFSTTMPRGAIWKRSVCGNTKKITAFYLFGAGEATKEKEEDCAVETGVFPSSSGRVVQVASLVGRGSMRIGDTEFDPDDFAHFLEFDGPRMSKEVFLTFSHGVVTFASEEVMLLDAAKRLCEGRSMVRFFRRAQDRRRAEVQVWEVMARTEKVQQAKNSRVAYDEHGAGEGGHHDHGHIHGEEEGFSSSDEEEDGSSEDSEGELQHHHHGYGHWQLHESDSDV